MSQNVSTNPKEREPSIGPTPIQPWSAESEADRLMDELFSDIDQILDGGNRLPTEPAKPEYVSLKSIVIPQLPKPSAVVPPPDTLSETSSPESTDSKLSARVETQVVATSNSRPNGFSLPLERLLLLVGFVVLGMSLILLLVKQKRLTLPEWLNPTPQPTVTLNTSQVSEPNDFPDYALRVLAMIDKKYSAKPQATTPPGATAANPTAPASVNSVQADTPPQRVIERVYIPVYPPQNPATPVAPPAVARPPAPSLAATIPSPSVAAKRVAPSPSVATKRAAPSPSPAPATKRATPTSPQAAAPVAPRITLPVLPTLPPSVIVPTVPMTQAPTSANKHTLVGVLEQGDRSAALFNAGGVTRYIFVGEAIGDSGWTLVSIANQEAVIRRNGEVRSVYAGQSF